MSRLGILAFLAFCGALSTPGRGFAQRDRCSNECFDQRRIRDWEALDDDLILIYVGRDRCPFLIEVDALYCDVRFLPLRLEIEPIPFGVQRAEARNFSGRVCTRDSRMRIVAGLAEVDQLDPEDACRIYDLERVSDDRLVELFVERDIVPPPAPVGIGEVTKVEDEEDGGAEPAEEDGSDE